MHAHPAFLMIRIIIVAPNDNPHRTPSRGSSSLVMPYRFVATSYLDCHRQGLHAADDAMTSMTFH